MQLIIVIMSCRFNELGPVICIWLGTAPFVMVRDPAIAKVSFVSIRNLTSFMKGPSFAFARLQLPPFWWLNVIMTNRCLPQLPCCADRFGCMIVVSVSSFAVCSRHRAATYLHTPCQR